MTTSFFQPGAQFFSGASSGGGGGGGGVVLGTSWYPLLPLQIPALADFNTTDAAVGGTTVTGDDFGVVINQPPSPAPFLMRYAYQAAPAAPYTATAALEGLITINFAGIAVRDGATNRLMALYIEPYFGIYFLSVSRMTDLTAISSTVYGVGLAQFERPAVFRIVDDGVDLSFWLSPNGFDWVQVYAEPRASWCANPTQVGFFSSNTPQGVGDPNQTVRCVSWQVT